MRAGTHVVVRQAWRNLRARPGQALLILLAMTLATSTLAMAIVVNKTGDHAWDRVWRDTRGGDVISWAGYTSGAIPTDASTDWIYRQLGAVAAAPGVAASAGPFANLDATGVIGAATVPLSLQVRDPSPSTLDQPLLTAGRWLSAPDGVVLEDALAVTLGVHVGDTVAIAGQSVPVVGTAVATSAPRYRPGHVGYVWITAATADRLRRGGARFQGAVMPIRLADPATAAAFARAHTAGPLDPDPSAGFEIYTQASVRDGQHEDLDTLAVALLVVGTVLALLMVAITAVLVTARVALHTRQIGMLKAVGLTPAQLAAVVLVENGAVAATSAVLGVLLGYRASPLLARSEAFLYGAPEAPPVSATTISVVLAVAIGVVALATIRPILIGARQTTLRALTPSARATTAAAWRWPVPRVWQVGLRALQRRPGRTMATALGQALAVALATIGIALHRSQAHAFATRATGDANRSLLTEIQAIIVVASVTVAVLALINTAIVATLAVRDGARSYAVMRAIGASPWQTVMSTVAGQLTIGMVGVVVGIPTGVVAFNALRRGLDPVQLGPSTVASVAAVCLLSYALIAAAPAVILSRRPIGPQLAYE